MVTIGLAACTRPPELIGIENPQVPAASVDGFSTRRVFITTTREASDKPGALFSDARARDLGLASVEVTIPPTHVIGQLRRPRQLPPDPRTEFTAVDPEIYESETAFIRAINRALLARPREHRTVLLFVHGFNNTPSDALLRVAQFVEDTGFTGVPVLLSWASAGRSLRYVYDLNSTLVARGKIGEVADILLSTKATGVTVFAHSMGSLLTMEGLVDLQKSGTLTKKRLLQNIVLAAPDIDIDLFRSQLDQLPLETRRKLYLLISKDDGALRLSSRIAGGVPRVGAADIASLEEFGLTVIDLSEISESATGSHSKFAGSPEVVQLIGAGMNNVGRFGEDSSPVIEQVLRSSPIRIFRFGR
jgi:esterase/lipase superfamily enzyme